VDVRATSDPPPVLAPAWRGTAPLAPHSLVAASQAGAASRPARHPAADATVDLASEYAAVKADLRQLTVISAICFAVLIGLTLLLR
jgi:hypothetical protein